MMVSIKYSFKFYFVVLLMIFSGIGNALAQTVPVKKLIDMETQANAAAARSNISIAMPHYEIPIRLLSEGKNVNADQKIYQSLVFEKNGEKYVRWVVNPEDTKWYKEVESFLVDKGISPERKTYFKGYQTASRSYIVVDPMSGAQFSIKSSTDRTGGAWRDKKQDYRDAYDILNISDLLDRTQQSEKFQNFVIMREPLFFGIKNSHARYSRAVSKSKLYSI